MSKELAFNVELPLSFEAAVSRVRDALNQEGFGVLTEIDLQAAFREKLGREIIETSKDAYVVKLLHAHAEVVSSFLANGMSEMMKNHPVPPR